MYPNGGGHKRSKRRTFEPAFKREAVELSCSSDMTQKRVAEELGISPNLLSKWRRELLDDASQPTSSGVARGREVERLRAELAITDDSQGLTAGLASG